MNINVYVTVVSRYLNIASFLIPHIHRVEVLYEGMESVCMASSTS